MGVLPEKMVEFNRQYEDLRSVLQEMAQAADANSEIPYYIGSSPILDQRKDESLSDRQAEAELEILAPLVSSKWSELNEYMIFELEPEARRTDDQIEKEAYIGLQRNYRELQEEIRKMHQVLEYRTSTDLTEPSQQKYVFEASTNLKPAD